MRSFGIGLSESNCEFRDCQRRSTSVDRPASANKSFSQNTYQISLTVGDCNIADDEEMAQRNDSTALPTQHHPTHYHALNTNAQRHTFTSVIDGLDSAPLSSTPHPPTDLNWSCSSSADRSSRLASVYERKLDGRVVTHLGTILISRRSGTPSVAYLKLSQSRQSPGLAIQ